MMGGDMPSDWQCPNNSCINHTKMVFGKNASCPKCGTARNAKQPGDWQCPDFKCQNHTRTVFASKSSCPRCGAARPGSGGGRVSYGSRDRDEGRHYESRNPEAAAAAFATTLLQGLKSGGRSIPGLAEMAEMVLSQLGGDSHRGRSSSHQGASSYHAAPPPSGGAPGDWLCPTPDCVNSRKMVFGKHSSCPKCGAEKPIPGQRTYTTQPGDWKCPNGNCQNSRNGVFAKHDSCPKCFTPKPGSRSRGREGRERSPYR